MDAKPNFIVFEILASELCLIRIKFGLVYMSGQPMTKLEHHYSLKKELYLKNQVTPNYLKRYGVPLSKF